MKRKAYLFLLPLAGLTIGAISASIANSQISSLKGEEGVHSDVVATFLNYDGSELYETRLARGSDVAYKGETPTKPSEGNVSFHFTGWDKSLSNLTVDTIFRAQYEVSYGASVATFLNIDGTYLYSCNVAYGTTPVYAGPAPTYSTFEGVTYTWTGWDKSLAPIQEDTTYVAVYRRVDARHRVIFHNQDGSILRTVYVADGESAELLAPSLPRVSVSSSSGETRSVESPKWAIDIDNVKSDLDVYPLVMTYDESFLHVRYDKEKGYLLNYVDNPYPGSAYWAGEGYLSLPSYYQGEEIYEVRSVNGINASILALPEKAKTIGSWCLNDSETLTSLIIGEETTRIEYGAFSNDRNLSNITFAGTSKLEYINDYAFQGCNVSTINIPDSILYIAENSFQENPIWNNKVAGNGCSYIELSETQSLATDFTNLDESIGAGLRGDCIGLYFNQPQGHREITCSVKDIVLPASFRFVGGNSSLPYAFNHSLSSLTLPAGFRSLYNFGDSISIDKLYYQGELEEYLNLRYEYVDWTINKLFIGGNLLTNLEVPSSITRISDSLFHGVKSLTSVSFPSTLEEIGNASFRNSNLSTLYLPSSLKYIGSSAFERCENLVVVSFDYGEAELTLSNNVFAVCYNLQDVNLLRPVSELPYELFSGCSALNSFTLPEGLKSIGSRCFSNCSNFNSLTLPSSVNSIGERAFFGAGFSWVDVPRSVSVLEYAAFPTNCNINYEGGIEQIYKNRINVGYNVNEYEALNYWLLLNGSTAYSLSLPSYFTALRDGIFANYRNIQSVSFMGNLTSIGKRAFYNCNSLYSISLPQSLVNFSADAFQGCSNLYDVSMNGNTHFYVDERGVIYDATRTSLVFVPSGVSGSFEIPEGTITIGDGAFALASRLTEIHCPSTLRIIGQQVVSNAALSIVELNEGLEYLSSRAFSGENYNYTIGTLNLPSSLKYVSDAFNNVSIEKLYIAEGFGENTSWMGSLTSQNIGEVHYPDSLSHLMEQRFRNSWELGFVDRALKLYCKNELGSEYLVTIEDLQNLDLIVSYGVHSPSYIENISTFTSSSIKEVSSYGFLETAIQTLTLSGLEYLDECALSRMHELRTVDFRGSSLKEIPQECFFDDWSLNLILLNDGVKKIHNAFSYYSDENVRRTVLVPSSLEYVSDYAFSYSGIVEEKESINILLPKDGLPNYQSIFASAGRYVNFTFIPYSSDPISGARWYLGADNMPVIEE